MHEPRECAHAHDLSSMRRVALGGVHFPRLPLTDTIQAAICQSSCIEGVPGRQPSKKKKVKGTSVGVSTDARRAELQCLCRWKIIATTIVLLTVDVACAATRPLGDEERHVPCKLAQPLQLG